MEDENLYHEIRKKLIHKYKTEILPIVSKYENIREVKHSSYKRLKPKNLGQKIGLIFFVQVLLTIFVFIILFIIGSFVPAQEQQQHFMNNIFAPIFISLWGIGFIFVILFYIFYFADFLGNIPYIKEKKDYKKHSQYFQRNVKNAVMPIVCSCFPDLKWAPDRIHQTEIYINLGLLPKQYPSAIPNYYSYLNYDDCFEGKYKGVQYVIEEVDAGISNKGKALSSFDGIIIQFKLNKSFKGHTMIIPDGSYIGFGKLHRTELEDVVFEKNYDVYTNDDVEARYLITPSFMKRINEIQSKFNAGEIIAIFNCGVFILALNLREDLFNYGSVINSLNDPKPFIKMSEELISVLKLIDYFKLDQNIGL